MGEQTVSTLDLHGLGGRLLRLAVLLTGNVVDAEDLVQSTLALALVHRDRVAAAGSPERYLRAVMVNALRAQQRRRGGNERPVSPATFPDRATTEDVAESVTQRLVLRRAMAALSPAQRVALVMRYYLDATDEEIAQALHCRRSTVRSHLRRGLDHIRRELGDAPDLVRAAGGNGG
jgi:RNA polymerase sigma factor (sigma-70 family)